MSKTTIEDDLELEGLNLRGMTNKHLTFAVVINILLLYCIYLCSLFYFLVKAGEDGSTATTTRQIRRRPRGIACNFQQQRVDVVRAVSPDPSPRATLSEKHDLTPGSKSAGLPRTKRVHFRGNKLSIFFLKQPYYFCLLSFDSICFVYSTFKYSFHQHF